MNGTDEIKIKEESIQWVKKSRKLICDKFANLHDYPASNRPFSFFMAGSPGAGKTEFSISFIKNLERLDKKFKIVRIDADEIRNILPLYNHKNSSIVQPAAALGVEKLFDCVQDKKQNFILDSTFADLSIAHKNIKRIVDKNRIVGIIYLYQEPKIAWDFTKKREKLEGRYVPKNIFINAFFDAKDNVNKIKLEFGSSVMLSLVIKNFKNNVEKTHLNIDKIENYLKIKYNRKDLHNALK